MKLRRPGVSEGEQRVEDILSTRRESLGKMVAVPILSTRRESLGKMVAVPILGRESGGRADRGF